MATLDIVIPVYNEGENITPVLDSFLESVRTPFRVLICYDRETDTTLPALAAWPRRSSMQVELVQNRGRGVHEAIMTGLSRTTAPWILTYTADDTFNAPIVDEMVRRAESGCDIVSASRFIPGGCMEGAPWLKGTLVRISSFTLYYLAGLPSRDATNGLRLFSRRVIERIPIESTAGFCYSIELLAKCHRLRWPVGEVPALWYERTAGESRFRVMKWLPHYLRWYFYAFATTWLRARDVPLRAESET